MINMNSKIYIFIIMVVMVSGCAVQSGPQNTIDFDGYIYTNNSEFRITGDLYLSRNAGPARDYRNVSLVFYDRNKQKIKTVSLGNMSTEPDSYPTERQLNITHDEVPKYIIIKSKDFWGDNNIEVTSLVIQDGMYYQFVRTGPDDTKFPCEIVGDPIDRVDAPHC